MLTVVNDVSVLHLIGEREVGVRESEYYGQSQTGPLL